MQIRITMPKLFGKTKLPSLGAIKRSKAKPQKLIKAKVGRPKAAPSFAKGMGTIKLIKKEKKFF